MRCDLPGFAVMLHATLFAILLASGIPAQGADAADHEERRFLAKQAEALYAFGRYAFDRGFPRQARRIWQEVLKEYAADHPATRAALGFRRVGTAWQEDEEFVFPVGDNPRGNLKIVEKRWNQTRSSVGQAHKAMAEEFHAAGRRDRATWHFGRALRFLPEDAGLQAASGMKSFYGLTGTELEAQLYERSKRMREIVAEELGKNYAVRALPSTDQTVYLTKAGIPHSGYATDNYRVWSNLPAAMVREVARNLERSRAFCSQIFTGAPGFHPADLRIVNYIFLDSERLYQKTLRANKDLFRPEIMEFLLERTAMCEIGKGADRAHLCGDATRAALLDVSIRWPVQAWSGMRSDAMTEGLGHAVVALFLGHITVYSMDLAPASRTVTKRQPGSVLVPDVGSWADMAIESAFRARGTPLANLPLVLAGNFPTETRVRAWSFCDYLLRRDPRLLLELDATRVAANPPEVRGLFHKSTGIQVDSLEREWRDFWTGATPVLRALRGNESPYGAASKDALKFLGAFDRLRKKFKPSGTSGDTDVTWNAAWSLNCKQHVEYLLKHKKMRGPEAEQTQDLDQAGATKKGQLFAQMALVATGSNPTKAMREWIHLPGYRDAILDPNLVQVGVYAMSGIAVFDVVRGVVPQGQSNIIVYPPNGAKGQPGSIAVADLGPEIRTILAGRKVGAAIGYPISLHTARGVGAATCDVTVKGVHVEGVVHHGAIGMNRRTSAPGMSVFYPFEPLQKGALVDVKWLLPEGRTVAWQFTVR